MLETEKNNSHFKIYVDGNKSKNNLKQLNWRDFYQTVESDVVSDIFINKLEYDIEKCTETVKIESRK